MGYSRGAVRYRRGEGWGIVGLGRGCSRVRGGKIQDPKSS